MTATEAEVSPASEMLRRRAEEKENVRQAGALTDGERAMQEANALFREGQFLKAAVGYSKAAKADPTNAVIQCNLAYALLKVNKFRQAAAAAGRCVEIDPSSFKGHFRRGLALLPLEDFEAAIDAFVLAVGASPANSPAQREAEQLLNRAKWLCKKHAEGEGKEVPSVAADAVDPDAEKEAMTAKQKMAQKQKMARQMRVKKHTKSMMDKVLADSEGVRELEDTPIGPGQKVASALDPSQIAELSTEDEVLSSKKRLVDGEKMPYDAERVGRFAAAELACVQDTSKREQYVHPIAIFLPGVKKEGWGDEGSGVGMRGAFDSQKTYQRMPTFLRDWAAKTCAHAVMIVVPKSQVAFPEVWRSDKQWPCAGDVDGYIVQLETPEADQRQAWFIELSSSGNVVTKHTLNAMRQCILPPVFQKIQTKTRAAKTKGKKKAGRVR